jgi:hypothetical protein
VAAYQWLKTILFLQLFRNLWSAARHSSVESAATEPGAGGHRLAALLLLAVAIYLAVLGLGLWNLKKWALFFILPIWIVDFTCDFDPQFFGLEHALDLWPNENLILVGLGLTITDLMSCVFLANRETFGAFNAEEAKIFWTGWR